MDDDQVRSAVPEDVASWLRLASEVEPLFGPMPDIAEYIQRGIARGTAFVIGPVGGIHGAMLLSRDGRPHHLIWLAVTASARGHGYAKALVQAALNRWPGRRIHVITFTEALPEGRPARRLYEHMGFTYVGSAEPAPDGEARDLFIRGGDAQDASAEW